MDLDAIQSELRNAGLDGWLFYDHHHRDPIAYRVLKIAPADVHAPLVLPDSGLGRTFAAGPSHRARQPRRRSRRPASLFFLERAARASAGKCWKASAASPCSIRR